MIIYKYDVFIKRKFYIGGDSLYKLIALDLDGTLIGKDGNISPQTKKNIEAVKQRGVKIILVSGREPYSVSLYAKELGLDDLIIALNGAIVTNREVNKILFRIDIDAEITKDVIRKCREKNIFNILFIGNELFAERDDKHLELFTEYSHAPVKVVRKLSKFYNGQSVGKILSISDYDTLTSLKNNLKKLYVKKINLDFSKPFFLEIYSYKTSKGIMLKKVADYYGIDRKEIIVIGDGENDISMIKYAGMGVAMGNALECVKKNANFVTFSNSDDGVSYAIEKFLLKDK